MGFYRPLGQVHFLKLYVIHKMKSFILLKLPLDFDCLTEFPKVLHMLSLNFDTKYEPLEEISVA